MPKAKNIINATSHYSHKKHCGAALTTTRVMLSGRVSMVSPPPRTALLILAWPEDDRWALWRWLSPPVDSSCCCEITLYQLSVQNNEYQVSMLSWSLWGVMIQALASFSSVNWCISNAEPTDSHSLIFYPGSSSIGKHFCCQFYSDS